MPVEKNQTMSVKGATGNLTSLCDVQVENTKAPFPNFSVNDSFYYAKILARFIASLSYLRR